MKTWIVLIFTLLVSVQASGETIRVAVAISLREAMSDIAKAYEAASGDQVGLVFGSSGQLMAQIKNGAEIDVFISAASQQMDELQKEQLVDTASRRIVVRNTLVLIVPADAKHPPDGFAALTNANVDKIAVGEPKTVPAGQYAKQVLDGMKLSQALVGKLVYGKNARQVLAYVEAGEVSAGIVYATDAIESGEKVRVVATADETTHEPIVYPAAVVSASKKQPTAQRFIDFLGTDDAKALFAKRGFGAPTPAPATKPATTRPAEPSTRAASI